VTGEVEDPTSLPPGPPDVDTWMGLPDDLFARIVPHVRRALAAMEGVQVTPEVSRLRALPATKLGRGRSRRRLLRALSDGGPLWVVVRTRVEGDRDLVRDLVEGLAAGQEPDRGDDGADDVAARLAAARRLTDDLRRQRDEAREERDTARRQRDGAHGREASLRDEVTSLQATVADLEAAVDRLEVRAADARESVEDAVAREARRGVTAREDLAAELAAARREVDDLRRERARREATTTRPGPARSASVTSRSPTSSGVGRRRPHVGAPEGVVPGRPSRLPAGLRVDTREGALALLRAVPTVLVDGYNVTRTHRSDLDLAGQRDWLVNGLATLAARIGVHPTVVFDAHLDGQAGATTRGAVRVQFSHRGVTADDEIVLAVEVLEPDAPIVVVTDDRELRARLAPRRIDLLPTAALAGLVR